MSLTIPLRTANITVGPDTPDGTVVYRQNTNPVDRSGVAGVTCTEAGEITVPKTLYSTPLARSSWSGSPYGGMTYETGVPGLSVAIAYSYYIYSPGAAFPYVATPNCGTTDKTCIIGMNNFIFDVVIIKTGPVSPGTISGANLPCAQQSIGNSSSKVDFFKTCFSGTVNVVSSTCTTPDVNVNLGSHSLTTLTGKGSTTPWVDASIKMTNCPIFYGSNIKGGEWMGSPVKEITAAVNTPNTIDYKLTPLTGIVDSANGIMNIDQTASQSALGVGIQIASGTTGSNTPFDFSASPSITLSSTQGTTMSIPLVARYIRTASSDGVMKAGKAKGKVTFLINYY